MGLPDPVPPPGGSLALKKKSLDGVLDGKYYGAQIYSRGGTVASVTDVCRPPHCRAAGDAQPSQNVQYPPSVKLQDCKESVAVATVLLCQARIGLIFSSGVGHWVRGRRSRN